MPDIPEDALTAATEAIGAHMILRESPRQIAEAALKAAAPGIRAGERQRIAREIPPDRLDQLAGWFDSDDEFKTIMFPGTWPEGSRGPATQADLRRWAQLLREDGET